MRPSIPRKAASGSNKRAFIFRFTDKAITYIRVLVDPSWRNILEIGPGCCNFALELCQRGYNFYGYDMVEQDIEVWRIIKSKYALEGNVILQDICTVDIQDNESYFDGIFAINTFEHIHDEVQALKNCYKLLKPGRRIAIIDGNILDPRETFRMIFKRRDGGIWWLFNKSKVRENYGMGWKGKAEDVKSIFWWKKALIKNGLSVIYLSTTSALKYSWTRKLGLWPFLGSVIAVGEKD